MICVDLTHQPSENEKLLPQQENHQTALFSSNAKLHVSLSHARL